MPKDFSINISDFIGIFRAIAEKANVNGGDTLEGEEISIFYDLKKPIIDKNQSIFIYDKQSYDEIGQEYYLNSDEYDSIESYEIIKNNKALEAVDNFVNNNKALEAVDNFVNNNKALEAVDNFVNNNNSDYYKTHPNYNNVKKAVTAQLFKRERVKNTEGIKDPDKKKSFEDKIEYVTKIILEKCDKYEIADLAPVIADMLGNETGGYVFSEKNLKNPGKQYKGVMQIDFETCCSIYGQRGSAGVDAGKNRNGQTLMVKAKKGDVIYKDWHKKHFSQDDERINELKKKYKTPEALYSAIQNDVELGLEVGIIAYKAKLHQKNGNVQAAVLAYCGSQYSSNITGIPKIFEI